MDVGELILLVIGGGSSIALVQELGGVMKMMICWVEINGPLEVGLVLVYIIDDHVMVGVSLMVCLDGRAACVALVL